MKFNFKKIFKSNFVKNVIFMMSGAAGAQAVAMLLAPLITRLYGPEAFGVLGTFTAITRTIGPIVALTYPIAIVLPRDKETATDLTKLSLVITFSIGFILGIVILFFSDYIALIFNIEELKFLLYFVPIVVLFSGIMQVTEQWLIRIEEFKINAKTHFYHSIIINGSKAGLGLVYPVALVLISLETISSGLRTIMMWSYLRKSGYKIKKQTKVNLKQIINVAKKYKDFPLFRAPEVFLSAFSQSLPVLLLTALFGPAATGFYNIGRTVLALPSMLIGETIGSVFYPRITKAAHKGEDLYRLIKKATLALAVIGVIPFGLIFLFGPTLFEFVFGEGWDRAGEYARWISLASFSIFINKPSVRAMPVLNAQKFHLIFTTTNLILRSISLVIGFFVFDSDVVAVAMFGITGFILNVILISITLNLSKEFYKNNKRR